MPPLRQARPRKKETFALDFNTLGKATVFSESTGRVSSLAPNIKSLSWSPTGHLIAYSLASHIRIWDPERSNVRQSIEIRVAGSANAIEKVAFSPAHEAILASTGADGQCRLWDVRAPGGTAVAGTGSKLADCATGEHGYFLTWHPKGQELLVGRKDDVVQLVDIRRMTAGPDSTVWEMSAQEKTPKQHFGQLNAMAFSNTGSHLFVTTGDGPVEVLKWPSLEQAYILDGHVGSSYAVQHSPAGNFVATGGSDSMLELWDTQNWFSEHGLSRPNNAVRDLSFSFDGAYIVAGGGSEARDGSANFHITHVETGEDILEVETQQPVSWVAWHPLRYWLAYAGDPGGLKILGAGIPML